MDRDLLFTHTQELFRPGMVTLVGSGASAAHGLPTMTRLAAHVVEAVEASDLIQGLQVEAKAEWVRIATALRAGEGLEAAIRADSMPPELGVAISQHVASAVQADETKAIDRMMTSSTRGVFATLIQHLFRVDTNPSIITTNYDRLIEVDLALDGIIVDSMFVGATVGYLNERLTNREHEQLERVPGRPAKSRRTSRQHVRLSKPHGSLDWMEIEGTIVKSDLPISAPRRVIAPGGSKYRLGYESPFDEHRARANGAIERASSFLVVGYGFNDDHLETKLRPIFPGVPALVLAHQLTPSARRILATNPEAIGVQVGSTEDRCLVISPHGEFELSGPYWKLDQLLAEAI